MATSEFLKALRKKYPITEPTSPAQSVFGRSTATTGQVYTAMSSLESSLDRTPATRSQIVRVLPQAIEPIFEAVVEDSDIFLPAEPDISTKDAGDEELELHENARITGKRKHTGPLHPQDKGMQ